LAAIGRDGNNNIYPMTIAIFEADVKDNWIWFFETLVSDIGPTPAQGWKFISDHQKVTFSFLFFFFFFCILQLIYLLQFNTNV
jgi:hypothetical protein